MIRVRNKDGKILGIFQSISHVEPNTAGGVCIYHPMGTTNLPGATMEDVDRAITESRSLKSVPLSR